LFQYLDEVAESHFGQKNVLQLYNVMMHGGGTRHLTVQRNYLTSPWPGIFAS